MAYAGIGKRFVAFFVDGIVFVVIGFVFALFSNSVHAQAANGQASAGYRLHGGSLLFWALFNIAYYTATEATFGGSLGKLATGLRVVDEHGDFISWGQSLGRNVLRVVDMFFFCLVGLVAIATSPTHQRVGDRAAGTYVVVRDEATATV